MERTNFSYLLAALLVFLVAVPLNDEFTTGDSPVARAVIFSLILLIGVGSLKDGGRYRLAGNTLVIAGVLLSILSIRTQHLAFQYGALLSLVGFLLVAISYTIRQIAIGNTVSGNRIIGAICIYLLLGVIWALLYSVLELAVPGSFAGFEAWYGQGWDSEWLYFSFVTMTTLGYGDVLPVSALARAMAYIQAILGQFYIAILVAGLVGAYIAQVDKTKE